MSWCQQIQHTYHPKLLSIGKIPHPLLQRMCRWCWEVGDQAWLGYWAGEEQESCKSQPLQLRINNHWKDSGQWQTVQQKLSHATSRVTMDMIKIQATTNRTTRDFTSSYKCDPWFCKETGTMVQKVHVTATNSSKKWSRCVEGQRASKQTLLQVHGDKNVVAKAESLKWFTPRILVNVYSIAR